MRLVSGVGRGMGDVMLSRIVARGVLGLLLPWLVALVLGHYGQHSGSYSTLGCVLLGASMLVSVALMGHAYMLFEGWKLWMIDRGPRGGLRDWAARSKYDEEIETLAILARCIDMSPDDISREVDQVRARYREHRGAA